MQIKYLGWQTFLLRTRQGVLATQPAEANLKALARAKANIILSRGQLQASWRQQLATAKSGPLFFWGPGEYESQGLEIWGVENGFWLASEGRWLFWTLTPKFSKKLRPLVAMQPDVLFLPINGQKQWAKQARELLDELSPAFVVPFAGEALTVQAMNSFEWLTPLLKLLDHEQPQPEVNFNLPLGEELNEERQLVILRPHF